MRPAVFFDRDGVLNRDESGYTHRPEDLRWMEGAVEAVRHANACGWHVFVVTNQSGVARGFYDEAAVERFHEAMARDLAAAGARVDAFRYCPYHPDGTVPAYRRDDPGRKPRPGMILDLMAEWPVDAARSLLIGDKTSDVEAAAAAGLRGFLFEGGDLSVFLRGAMASAATSPAS